MIVDDPHFAYLRLQKGSLDGLSGTRSQWLEAYENDLQQTLDDIAAYLPATCWGFLDIGSGLGGIDAKVYRHYELTRGNRPQVNLLDGVDDPPVMHLHRETFNDMTVAKDFLKKNGVPREKIATHGPASDFKKPYDLVMSFGSWCFHYAPDEYLPRLLGPGGLHRDSVLIVDLRTNKPEWQGQLERHFSLVATIRRRPKWQRVVYDFAR